MFTKMLKHFFELESAACCKKATLLSAYKIQQKTFKGFLRVIVCDDFFLILHFCKASKSRPANTQLGVMECVLQI